MFKGSHEFKEKAVLMDEETMRRTITRMAHEILEKNAGIGELCLVGIQRRGVPIAQRIAEAIERIEGQAPAVGTLDITFYRDDLSMLDAHPVLNGTQVPFAINDKTLVLVDDVLYTGRTVRSAIDALMDMGRPAKIQLAILIDRGHRELPIRGDFIGKNVPTSKNELVSVEIRPFEEMDRVILYEKKEGEHAAKA